MADESSSSELPDRLSLDPRSPHFNEDLLKRGREWQEDPMLPR